MGESAQSNDFVIITHRKERTSDQRLPGAGGNRLRHFRALRRCTQLRTHAIGRAHPPPTMATVPGAAGFGAPLSSTPKKVFAGGVGLPSGDVLLRCSGACEEEAMARWRVAARLEDELERRRQYRGSLVERHPDGSTGGVDTRKVERALLERVHPPSPLLVRDPREVSGLLLLPGG
jgi:hypothetical protein